MPESTTSNGYFDVALSSVPFAAAQDDGTRASLEVNDFGFDLLRALGDDGNLCASPASVALALAMARAGARGQTAAEMDAVLHGFGADGRPADVAGLIQSLRKVVLEHDLDLMPGSTPDPALHDNDAELNVVSQAFLQKGMPFEPAYLDRLSSTFDAGAGLLDFASDPDAALEIINQWVSDQTKGRIPHILQSGDVGKATRFALANALYLRAYWQNPFDPDSTESLPFTTASGTRVTVATMKRGGLLQYSAGNGYRAVDLPYEWADLAMTIVIPDDMATFTKSLTATRLDEIVGAEQTYMVDLTLPRFSVDSRFELKGILSAMGMPTAFDSTADFSGITRAEALAIGNVIHQANMDVDERGTTAAAATVVTGRSIMGPVMPPPATFHVDRPFLYFIRDTVSGTVLFMGRIVDPS
jgi:serpin B